MISERILRWFCFWISFTCFGQLEIYLVAPRTARRENQIGNYNQGQGRLIAGAGHRPRTPTADPITETRVPPSGSPAASESPMALQSPAHNELAGRQLPLSLLPWIFFVFIWSVASVPCVHSLAVRGERKVRFWLLWGWAGMSHNVRGLSEASGKTTNHDWCPLAWYSIRLGILAPILIQLHHF